MFRFQQGSLLFANRKQNEVESGKPRTKREYYANRFPEKVRTWFASKPLSKRNLQTTCEHLFLNHAFLVNQGPGFCEPTIWIGFQHVDFLRTIGFQKLPEPSLLVRISFHLKTYFPRTGKRRTAPQEKISFQKPSPGNRPKTVENGNEQETTTIQRRGSPTNLAEGFRCF